MAAPANDNIANAQVLTSGTQVTGTTAEATVEAGELRGTVGGPGPSVWYIWDCPTPAPPSVQFDTIGTSFDSYLSIFQKVASPVTAWGDLSFVVGDDDGGGSGTSRIVFTPVAGRRYWIQVCGYSASYKGNYVLNYPPPGAFVDHNINDNIANAIVLQPGTTSTPLVESFGATAEAGELTGLSNSSSTQSAAGFKTMWWRWRAPRSGSATITTEGSVVVGGSSAADTYLSIFKAKSGSTDPVASVTNVELIASNDDSGGGQVWSSVTFTATAGTVYYLQVRLLNVGSSPGYFKLNYPSPAAEGGDGPQSLFTTQLPVITDNIDNTPTTLGTTMRFAADGEVLGVRFRSTATLGGTYSAAFYQVQASDPSYGPPLATKALAVAPSPSSWTTILFDTPVPVTAGVPYRPAMHNSQGRYVATLGFFTTDLVNGDITADADDDVVAGYTIFQGVYRSGSFDYPSSPAEGTSYFVDVIYQRTSPGEPVDATPAGVQVPAAAGSPSAALNRSAAPNGVAVSRAAGTPSVSLNRNAGPSGVSVTATPGAASASLNRSAAPGGVAVGCTPGSPSVALNRAASPNGVFVPVAPGQPSGPGITPTPVGVLVPVSVGAPSTQVPGARPNGVLVTVAAGTASATLSRSAAPAGVLVPATAGSAAAALSGAVPAGCAVGATPGQPSAAVALAASPDGVAVAVTAGSASIGQPQPEWVEVPDLGFVDIPDLGVVLPL